MTRKAFLHLLNPGITDLPGITGPAGSFYSVRWAFTCAHGKNESQIPESSVCSFVLFSRAQYPYIRSGGIGLGSSETGVRYTSWRLPLVACVKYSRRTG